jgi:multimeric flavodoxin WrbA
MSKKVVAIVGSYRRGGSVDSIVDAVLEGAREKGAETRSVYLSERNIRYCTNCRRCADTPGPERGRCLQKDDLEDILTEIEAADAVVLGSPVNWGNATAVFRTFLERSSGCAFYPPGKFIPIARTKVQHRKAVLVASASTPGVLIPLLTGTSSALRTAARLLGAKTVGYLWMGLASRELHHPLSARNRERARRLGWKLA